MYFPQSGANATIFENAVSPSLHDQVFVARPALDETSLVFSSFAAELALVDPYAAANTSHAASSYDAMFLLALGSVWAMAQEDRPSGTNIAKGLRRLTSGSEEDAQRINLDSEGWPVGIARMQAGQRIEVVGASGPMEFDPNTEERFGPLELIQADQNGDFTVRRVCRPTPPDTPTDCTPSPPDEL